MQFPTEENHYMTARKTANFNVRKETLSSASSVTGKQNLLT
jgi:hypothetical protein